MTHDELLERVNDQDFAYDRLAEAVMAVMKLHNPYITDCECCGRSSVCDGCGDNFYPCLTIQAIEKELV